jgi:hypothetical protein
MPTIPVNRGLDDNSRIVRRAFLGAGLACILALAAGVLALDQQLGLLRTACKTVDEDLASSAWASRAAVSALECRRYEKDVFLNLNDAATHDDYLRKWNAALQTLHDDLAQLEAVSPPGQARLNVDECLVATEAYRKQAQDIVSAIGEGPFTRPEDANRAITPFKADFRRVASNTAAMAEEALAEASRSGALLEQSLLLNIGTTALLLVLPSGLILAWTVWLTRGITARNVKVRQREDRLDSIIIESQVNKVVNMWPCTCV